MEFIELTEAQNNLLIALSLDRNHKVESRKGNNNKFYVSADVLDEQLFDYAHVFLFDKPRVIKDADSLF